MKFIADFHIHSKYSRATSPQMDLENLDKWAKIKGIKVIGTGDFTHPEWFKELREKLEPAEPGLFKLKHFHSGTRFILTAEISCIYSKTRANVTSEAWKKRFISSPGGRVRKIHIIVIASSFEIVEKINAHLGWIGNLKADGRPILGLDAKELVKIVLNISEECLIVPAHLMTPWFSLFGSKSGFDSLEECFEEYSKYIFAGETGLSADPKMLWRMPDCRRIALISNSDAHSPQKIGREANVFDTELSYSAIIEAIKSKPQVSEASAVGEKNAKHSLKDPKKFLYTIEFFPEEGKYHFDGHRNCNICLSPQESKKSGNICPNCGKSLTIGVLNRVEELADRPACQSPEVDRPMVGGPDSFKPENIIPFKSLIPLTEIIADVLDVGSETKQVMKEYENLIEKFKNEFNILLEVSRSEIETASLPEIAEAIIRVRQGKVFIEPGYDGLFGKISIFSKTQAKRSVEKKRSLFEGEQGKISKQKTLF